MLSSKSARNAQKIPMNDECTGVQIFRIMWSVCVYDFNFKHFVTQNYQENEALKERMTLKGDLASWYTQNRAYLYQKPFH